ISWLLLHTMAVNYPEIPNHQRKNDMLLFWQSFSRLYPCGKCAKHMRDKLLLYPPNNYLNSNKEYMQWLCNFHNQINIDLNKSIIDCNNYELIYNKFKSDQYCGCDNEYIENVDHINNQNNQNNQN